MKMYDLHATHELPDVPATLEYRQNCPACLDVLRATVRYEAVPKLDGLSVPDEDGEVSPVMWTKHDMRRLEAMAKARRTALDASLRMACVANGANAFHRPDELRAEADAIEAAAKTLADAFRALARQETGPR